MKSGYVYFYSVFGDHIERLCHLTICFFVTILNTVIAKAQVLKGL